MSDILFYRADGVAAVGHIENGRFQQTQSVGSFTQNWSEIAVVGDQLL